MTASSPCFSSGLQHSIARCVLLPFFLCVTSSSDVPVSSLPVPHEGLAKREAERAWSLADVRIPDPDLYSQRLDLFLEASATSWLDIRWRLDNETGAGAAAARARGAPSYSRVRCHLGNATIFHNVFGAATRFRIPNLASNTEYIVCVEMLEGRVLHFRCARFSTIPLVRPDSILGLLLTVGYVLGMGMIGYVTWWMRVRKHATTSQKLENEMELSCRTSTVRCSEIEERTHLNSNQSQQSPASPTTS